jgi:hypothetical protein
MIDKEKLLKYLKRKKNEYYTLSVNLQCSHRLQRSFGFEEAYDAVNEGKFDLPQDKGVCRWKIDISEIDYYDYTPSCDNSVYFRVPSILRGTNYRYCPNCGLPIEEVRDEQ